MPDFLQFVSTLREQMQAELTRTDVLRPLIWPIMGFLLSLIGSLTFNAPNWVLISIMTLLALTVALYIAGYIYFGITDPDSLRSEKYKLQKMAIEQGYFGDSDTGLIEKPDPESLKNIHPKPSLTDRSAEE